VHVQRVSTDAFDEDQSYKFLVEMLPYKHDRILMNTNNTKS
jgi:hypothetical protein